MKIGTIDFGDKPLFLAPMENVTDPSFRQICKSFGADMVYTEFVPSEALIRDVQKSKKKLTFTDAERPVGIQLYGHNIEPMVESAQMAAEAGPDLIDLNFGCPVRKIATRGAGAGLLRDIPKMIKMTEAIVKAVDLPVTAKTRLGWDDSDKPIVEVAERLQDVGIQALTIHGRTRAQLYKGTADWTLIGAVKNNPRMTIPVIGNGDVTGPEVAAQYFDRYGVDGIMIGRATYGRPYIFREIKHFLETGQLLPPPSLPEKVDIAKQHFRHAIEWKDRRGIFEMRRHFVYYFKGLPNFKETRLRLLTCEEPDEILNILNEIAEQYADM